MRRLNLMQRALRIRLLRQGMQNRKRNRLALIINLATLKATAFRMERRIFGFSLTQEATAAQGQTLWNQHYLLFYFAVKKKL